MPNTSSWPARAAADTELELVAQSQRDAHARDQQRELRAEREGAFACTAQDLGQVAAVVVLDLGEREARDTELEQRPGPNAGSAFELHRVAARDVEPALALIDVVAEQGGREPALRGAEAGCAAERELVCDLAEAQGAAFRLEASGREVERVLDQDVSGRPVQPELKRPERDVAQAETIDVCERLFAAYADRRQRHRERSTHPNGRVRDRNHRGDAERGAERVDREPRYGYGVPVPVVDAVGAVVEGSIGEI